MGELLLHIGTIGHYIFCSVIAVILNAFLFYVLYTGVVVLKNNVIKPLWDKLGDWLYNITHKKV